MTFSDGMQISNVTEGAGGDVIAAVLRSERRYATIGLVIGALVIAAGIVMIFLNIGGQVDLTIQSAKVNTAVVGIPMAVIGALIIFATRFKFTVRKK
jgi:hypothetical protein